MRDFEKQWAQIERRGNRIRVIAMIWSGLIMLFFAAAVAGGIYALLKPEVIGEFFGRMVAGFEAGHG